MEPSWSNIVSDFDGEDGQLGGDLRDTAPASYYIANKLNVNSNIN